MYVNDVNIFCYLIIAIIGGIVGQFLPLVNKRLEEEKGIFTKEYLNKKNLFKKLNYPFIITMAILYVIILYICKIQFDFVKDLKLIKYLILAPMLVSAFVIDYKLQIIPNRLNLTIFETGLIFTFLYGALVDLEVAKDMLLGSVIGAGIFLIITLIGGVIAGKEAMGFGDVKLMGAMGFFFGGANMIAISVISFLIGAIISVFLLVTKIKNTDEYIPFGPFIVIAAFIVMCVPFPILFMILLKIFSLGLYKA